MKKIFEDYIEYLKIPTWDKGLKKLRSQTIQNWYKKDYQEVINYTELQEFETFAKENGFHYKTYFFYEKIEFDIYYHELVEKRNLALLKSLYKTNGASFYSNKRGIDIDLLELGLQIDATDNELLKEKLKRKISFLRLTIHEVPWIVIAFGANSANVEDTKKLFAILEETIQLSQKLNEQIDEKLINDCLFYWSNWIDFLENINDCTDFEEHLKKQQDLSATIYK